MNSAVLDHPVRPVRTRLVAAVSVLLLGAVAVTFVSSRRGEKEEELKSSVPASVARVQLETRAGLFYLPGATVPYSGWITDSFKEGGVKLRTAVAEGQLHGVSEGWQVNGGLELRESFHRGVAHGTRTTWHPNGKQRSEGQLVAGLQQGTYRQWHEDGTLAAEAEFKDGKAHGLSRAWHPSGCLKAEALMKDGVVVTRHFYPDGERREPTLLAKSANP